MADLDQLRTFLAVYRAGSFTRAAVDLHVSQPTVSLHIKSLEQQVGRRLFRRVASRGIEPTAAGLELAQTAARHLDALEGLLGTSDAGRDSASVGDTVLLGGPAEFMSVRVAPALSDLIAANELRVRMYFDIDAPIVERLVSGELDIAVTTAQQSRRGLDVERLSYEYLELVAAPSWRQRLGPIAGGAAGATQLEGTPVIAYDEELPLVTDFWREVFGTPASFRAAAVANSLRAALAMAIEGAGVTVLPTHVCAEALGRGDLVRLIELDQPPRNQLWLVRRSGALRRSAVSLAYERIVAAARDW